MSTRFEAKTFTLEYLKTIGILSNAAGRGFSHPYDLAISKDGRIFVLNRCDPLRYPFIRVGVCNLEEDYLAEFGNGFGSGDGQFVWPVSLTFDSQDRLYVTDEHAHRVSVFDSSGEFLSKWGVFGHGDGQLNGPAGIAVNANGRVYIADQHNNRVQVFTTDGRYLWQWGEEGSGDGRFNLPWGITLDSQGNVYVADWRNDRIQKFDAEGRFLAGFGQSGSGDGQFHRPSGVAVDTEGYIYVADWGNERIQVLGPDGGFQVKLRGQATLSKWAEEFLAANPDEKQERDKSNLVPNLPPHLDTPYLVSAQTERYFWGPVSVNLDSGGRLYITETNRHRIQIYQKR